MNSSVKKCLKEMNLIEHGRLKKYYDFGLSNNL